MPLRPSPIGLSATFILLQIIRQRLSVLELYIFQLSRSLFTGIQIVANIDESAGLDYSFRGIHGGGRVGGRRDQTKLDNE